MLCGHSLSTTGSVGSKVALYAKPWQRGIGTVYVTGAPTWYLAWVAFIVAAEVTPYECDGVTNSTTANVKCKKVMLQHAGVRYALGDGLKLLLVLVCFVS